MKRLVLLGLMLCVWCGTTMLRAQGFPVSESKYDYTEVVQQIVGGKTDKMQQAEAIYRWMCRNIVYDTNYQIFTADQCWDQKRGVCQAYCELFYRLAEPLGLKTIIISGKTKDLEGQVSSKGHTWLLVEVEGGNILIDPTWGAGGLKDGVFQRKENDMSWFHIDPHWLIFTHYPDDAQFQFLENPVSWKTFVQMPAVFPSLGLFGWDARETFLKVLKGEIRDLPTFHEDYADCLDLYGIPAQQTLRVGQTYDFRVRKKNDLPFALIHDGEFVHEAEWQCTDNDYHLQYMPVAGGTLKISVLQGPNKYQSAVTYRVAKPNAQELAIVEQQRPMQMPELKQVKNLDRKRWKSIGIDEHKLLDEVRKGGIKSLPILYKDAEQYLSEVSIPYSATLKVGQTYTFSFIPLAGADWQIINQDDWYYEWTKDEATGRITMQVTPLKKGRLKVSVQPREGLLYKTMVGYEVQ